MFLSSRCSCRFALTANISTASLTNIHVTTPGHSDESPMAYNGRHWTVCRQGAGTTVSGSGGVSSRVTSASSHEGVASCGSSASQRACSSALSAAACSRLPHSPTKRSPCLPGGKWRRHVSWCARAGEVVPARGVCAAQAAAVSSRACVRLGRVAGPDTHGGREARRATGRSRRQRKVAHS